jgi:hypothetical protein
MLLTMYNLKQKLRSKLNESQVLLPFCPVAQLHQRSYSIMTLVRREGSWIHCRESVQRIHRLFVNCSDSWYNTLQGGTKVQVFDYKGAFSEWEECVVRREQAEKSKLGKNTYTIQHVGGTHRGVDFETIERWMIDYFEFLGKPDNCDAVFATKASCDETMFAFDSLNNGTSTPNSAIIITQNVNLFPSPVRQDSTWSSPLRRIQEPVVYSAEIMAALMHDKANLIEETRRLKRKIDSLRENSKLMEGVNVNEWRAMQISLEKLAKRAKVRLETVEAVVETATENFDDDD